MRLKLDPVGWEATQKAILQFTLFYSKLFSILAICRGSVFTHCAAQSYGVQNDAHAVHIEEFEKFMYSQNIDIEWAIVSSLLLST